MRKMDRFYKKVVNRIEKANELGGKPSTAHFGENETKSVMGDVRTLAYKEIERAERNLRMNIITEDKAEDTIALNKQVVELARERINSYNDNLDEIFEAAEDEIAEDEVEETERQRTSYNDLKEAAYLFGYEIYKEVLLSAREEYYNMYSLIKDDKTVKKSELPSVLVDYILEQDGLEKEIELNEQYKEDYEKQIQEKLDKGIEIDRETYQNRMDSYNRRIDQLKGLQPAPEISGDDAQELINSNEWDRLNYIQRIQRSRDEGVDISEELYEKTLAEFDERTESMKKYLDPSDGDIARDTIYRYMGNRTALYMTVGANKFVEIPNGVSFSYKGGWGSDRVSIYAINDEDFNLEFTKDDVVVSVYCTIKKHELQDIFEQETRLDISVF